MISCLREPLRPDTSERSDRRRTDWEKSQRGRVFWYATGRSALFQVLQAFGWESGSKVLLPAYIAAGVIEPIRALGLKVLFYETSPGLLIRPGLIRDLAKRDRAIRAMVAVHPMGWPQPLDELGAICRKHEIVLIEDCAQAMCCHDGEGRPLGNEGDIALFSFTKFIGFPEGAAIVLRNPSLQAPKPQRVRPRTIGAAVRWYRLHLSTNRAAHRAADAGRGTRLLIRSGGYYDRYYKLISADFRPLRLPAATIRSIVEFDWQEMARRRRDNVARLYRESQPTALEWIFPKDAAGWVPLAVPARVKRGDRKEVVARAMQQGVFLASLCSRWDFVPAGRGFTNEKEYLDRHVLVPINEHLKTEEMTHLIGVLDRL